LTESRRLSAREAAQPQANANPQLNKGGGTASETENWKQPTTDSPS